MNKILQMIKSSAIKFIEQFTTNYSPIANNTWYSNVFNNWDWYSCDSAGYGLTRVTSGLLDCATGGSGTNYGLAKIKRTLEGYNINRSFDLSFSFSHLSNVSNSSFVSMSMCGNIANVSPNETLHGLEFRSYWYLNSSVCFSVFNNGSLLGVPYSGLGLGTKYYAFVQKRGNTLGITINSTGVKPATPAFNYTINDKTSLSNSLIAYAYATGYGDGSGHCQIGDINILLL